MRSYIKKFLIIFAVIFAVKTAWNLTKDTSDYLKIAQTGDLIFQTEVGIMQGHAIQLGTLSKFNHVGVVVKENGNFYVYEALGKVQKTKLKSFIDRKNTYSRFGCTSR